MAEARRLTEEMPEDLLSFQVEWRGKIVARPAHRSGFPRPAGHRWSGGGPAEEAFSLSECRGSTFFCERAPIIPTPLRVQPGRREM